MSHYDAAKDRFIMYLGLFANNPLSAQMTDANINVVSWACISTWSNFQQEHVDLHIIWNAWQAQDFGHQRLLTSTERNQSNDAVEMFKALMANPDVMAAVGRLNQWLEQAHIEFASMSEELKGLFALINALPAIIERLSLPVRVHERTLALPLPEDERTYTTELLGPLNKQLQAATAELQRAQNKFATDHPAYLERLAYVNSFPKFQQELSRSFAFFRSDAAPSVANELFVGYCGRYNVIRARQQPMVACVEEYNALNDYMEWYILSRKGQTDLDFDNWRALKLSGNPLPQIVVAATASPELQAAAQNANSAAAASSVALVRASVSPSPSRAPSAAVSPVSGLANSASIAPSRTSSASSRSSLGSVAASVSSDQQDVVATPLGTFASSVSVPRSGGGKKKTRSNHKRSAHKHKRSAHKRSAHKRSAHKRSAHKRSAHKRSAHKKL
jgi:hypothetical protein